MSDDASFQDLMQITPLPLRPAAERLRALVLSVHPDACEVVRLGDRAASFGVGPKKMSEAYCYILPYTKWVNLGFYRGAELTDPDGLLVGSGARMRHVKIRDPAACDSPLLRRLIAQALEERRTALGRG